ncbi:nucleoside triphosphate pyrophosphohydrolase [Granulibacter bethesdensis]|uniref:MazG protein n=1 Tax=Granulibacter bethesdensis (strain ATCC BAA-1260 / CGDNIH1) TaxID=391165 RepID=Q0BT28_GRABC|nr:nucleoside triphosphate pyrophosphohydrolase [Granulibacter bethesdensis]ABI62024.1 MazG protein [Granulibacter bethesdensis CGDNIH1]AHJ69080.1 MazG protein [Granulibacter bethesdensis]APH51844.1 MazG protein [Granulibacter bethesdensis]APH64535.1 MazG protein [Granulibacter bethesdensis]
MSNTDPAAAIGSLLNVMRRLRDPEGGCPWDIQQSFATIAPYTIEEAYEVADAISRGDRAALQDELGDLLLQVVYHAQMASEEGSFDFASVTQGITDKMIRRHPHVFAPEDCDPATSGHGTAAWEARKQAERLAKAETGVLAGISTNLPALSRAAKLTARAARVGFDWSDANAVLEKLAEETAELRAELPSADPERLADELGDMMFVMANLARKLRLDPETVLRAANAKFERRFNAVEASLAQKGLSPADAGLDAMEAEWQAVKKREREVSQP